MVPETRPSRLYWRQPGAPRRRRVWVLAILSTGALIAAVLLLFYTLTQKTVTLDVGGHVRRFRTHADTVQAVLDESHVLIDREDLIDPPPATRLKSGETITVRKALVVAVEADGVVRQVRTQSVHPLDVLAGLNIPIEQYDVIQIDGRSYTPEYLENTFWTTPTTFIRVIRSAAVNVIDKDHTLLVHTTQADVGRALDSVGLTLYLADRVTPDLSTPVTDGLSVVIDRSVPLTIVADGQRLATRAAGPTVGDALAEVGIAPVDLDYTIPAENSRIEADMVIRLVRVTETLITTQTAIPYETIRQPDPALAAGTERVVRAGVDGLREIVVNVRYEDGREVRQTVQDERVIQAPAPRLVLYGPTVNDE